MNDLKWESSVPRAQGQVYHLRGGPQPPNLVPPPGPAGIYGMRRA